MKKLIPVLQYLEDLDLGYNYDITAVGYQHLAEGLKNNNKVTR